MTVYRITRNKHLEEDLKGIGASIAPGRWNSKGIFCIYAAETRALALVENMANITRESYIYSKFTMRTLFIPDDCILEIEVSNLSSDWRDKPPPVSTRNFGTQLLQNKQTLAYALPSSIIPQELIVVIDPLHPDIKKLKIVNDELLDFDFRLKG